MHRSDSSFGRLSAAWHARPASSTVARSGVPSDLAQASTAVDGREVPVLLVLKQGQCSGNSADATRLPARAGGHYCVLPAAVACIEDLAALLSAKPRLVVVDADLAESLGVAALSQLQRVRGGPQWLIAWFEPMQRWAELLLQLDLRGCVNWNHGGGDLARALDAVSAGELWFPRWVMQWLYLSALDAARLDAAPGFQQCRGPRGELTEREREVLALACQGSTNKQIGERLGVSINTVKKHLAAAFEKRGLQHRRQLKA